ncbi:MAG: biopolymer transporter ExbD [Gammaproteobacteria bacterium]
MRFRQPVRKQSSDEHLIPLINVVFLMLIFFMIVGRITASDIFTVKPPESASETDVEPTSITVLVGSDGALAVDGALVSLAVLPDAIADKLRLAQEQKITPAITVKADGGITVEALQPVLNALRAAGSGKITLMTVRGR